MLAVVYKGVAIPVYWLLLNKRGNSATRERIALMKRFIHQFGKTHLIALLADREFIGSDWFAWLKHEGIDFHVRIKKNALLLRFPLKFTKLAIYDWQSFEDYQS